ncbi:MAG: sulfatase-like hydrolase/transferase [Rubrobacteraceae bacterium]
MNRKLTRRDFLKVAGAGAAGAAVLAASGCGEVREQVERRIPEGIRLLGKPEKNVVFVISDTLRKDHVGAYGNDWIRTPNLDALARESLRLTRAYPESIPSIPARRSMHTGFRTWPFRHWESPYEDDVNVYGWQPVPADQTTLAEMLRDTGVETAFVTDTLHQFRPSYNFHRGFNAFHFVRGQERDLYRPAAFCPPEKLDQVLLGGPKAEGAENIMRQYLANTVGREREEDWFTPQVFLKAMEFLEGLAMGGDPFFLTVDAYDPHEPWDPPEEYVALYDDGYDGKEPATSSSGDSSWLTERQLERMKALYAGEVTMVDRWLGNFLDKMAELDLMENTLVVFVSDHGHAFGEHGVAGKVSSAIYPELTDIPFMIRDPEGKAAGETNDFFAATHDIPATILGFLDVGASGGTDGLDLTPLFEGEAPDEERSHFSTGYHDYSWARDEKYIMFCQNKGGDAHLFDAENDPDQNTDLAGENPDIVERMFDEYILEDAGGSLPNY